MAIPNEWLRTEYTYIHLCSNKTADNVFVYVYVCDNVKWWCCTGIWNQFILRVLLLPCKRSFILETPLSLSFSLLFSSFPFYSMSTRAAPLNSHSFFLLILRFLLLFFSNVIEEKKNVKRKEISAIRLETSHELKSERASGEEEMHEILMLPKRPNRVRNRIPIHVHPYRMLRET